MICKNCTNEIYVLETDVVTGSPVFSHFNGGINCVDPEPTFGKIQLIKEFRTMMLEKFGIRLGLKQTKDCMDLVYPLIEKMTEEIKTGSRVKVHPSYRHLYAEGAIDPYQEYTAAFIDRMGSIVLTNSLGEIQGTVHKSYLQKAV